MNKGGRNIVNNVMQESLPGWTKAINKWRCKKVHKSELKTVNKVRRKVVHKDGRKTEKKCEVKKKVYKVWKGSS